MWQTGLSNPNFSEYASICGGTGIRVENENDIAPAFEKALSSGGPALIEIMSDPDLT